MKTLEKTIQNKQSRPNTQRIVENASTTDPSLLSLPVRSITPKPTEPKDNFTSITEIVEDDIIDTTYSTTVTPPQYITPALCPLPQRPIYYPHPYQYNYQCQYPSHPPCYPSNALPAYHPPLIPLLSNPTDNPITTPLTTTTPITNNITTTPTTTPTTTNTTPTTPVPTTNTNTINTTSNVAPYVLPPCIKGYINETLHLDFTSKSCINVFQPWLGEIKVNKKKTCDENFKTYIIRIAKEMNYRDLPFLHKLELCNAIIRCESYVAGFPKPIMTPCHFHKLWLILENATRNDPSQAPYVLKCKRNKTKMKYVDMLSSMFPTFLHTVYRKATKTLGSAATTEELCEYMKSYAALTYSDCPICSKLKMNKY